MVPLRFRIVSLGLLLLAPMPITRSSNSGGGESKDLGGDGYGSTATSAGTWLGGENTGMALGTYVLAAKTVLRGAGIEGAFFVWRGLFCCWACARG